MKTDIQQSLATVKSLVESIASLDSKIATLQAELQSASDKESALLNNANELQSASDKESALLNNANLSREEKTAGVVHIRALKDVIVSDIASANAEKESTEDAAFRIRQRVPSSNPTFMGREARSGHR